MINIPKELSRFITTSISERGWNYSQFFTVKYTWYVTDCPLPIWYQSIHLTLDPFHSSNYVIDNYSTLFPISNYDHSLQLRLIFNKKANLIPLWTFRELSVVLPVHTSIHGKTYDNLIKQVLVSRMSQTSALKPLYYFQWRTKKAILDLKYDSSIRIKNLIYQKWPKEIWLRQPFMEATYNFKRSKN